MELNKSILGYRKGSPYENDPFIDIFSPEGLIDMSDTPKDLMGIDNEGNVKVMEANSTIPYQFSGDVIREIPLEYKKGGLTPKQYALERGLKLAYNRGDFDNITPNKARQILHDKKVNGKPLTKEQYRLFGYLSKGHTLKYQMGGNPYMQYGGNMNDLFSYLFEEDEAVPEQVNDTEDGYDDTLVEREKSVAKRERELQDEMEYNQALSLVMGQMAEVTNNPFAERPVTATGVARNPFKTESVGNPAKYSYNFFLSKGYSPHIAAGIVANLQHESNFNLSAVGDKGKARGIAQWHPDRYNKLKDRFDLSSLDGSLEAVHYELQGTENRAFNKISGAKTPEEAAMLVDRHFERSAGLSTDKRMNTARNIYNTNY